MLHNNKKVNLNNLFLYTLLFILILMIFWFVYDGNISNPFTSHIGPFILFIVSLGLIILLYKKDCSYKHLYNVVIGAGIFIRVWYTLWTPYNVRSHDLGNISEDSSGHAAYIIYIFKTASLPKTNDGQFYHPPLFHALAAFIMKIFSVMHPKDDVVTMLQDV